MLQKYNLVYLPLSNREQFIEYAKSLAQISMPDKYLLGIKSIPHVSLCQFETEKNKIETIWSKVKALNLPPLNLIFAKQRSKTYEGHPKWGNVCWVSLIPDHIDKLAFAHLEIAKIIKTPLNAAFANYDPHLTLFSSQDEASYAYLNHQAQVKPPLEEQFIVALGTIDEVGQVTEILFKD